MLLVVDAARSVAVIVATAATVPTVVVTAQTVVFALRAVAALPHAGSVELRLARTTAVSATMNAATATGPEVLLTATAR